VQVLTLNVRDLSEIKVKPDQQINKGDLLADLVTHRQMLEQERQLAITAGSSKSQIAKIDTKISEMYIKSLVEGRVVRVRIISITGNMVQISIQILTVLP